MPAQELPLTASLDYMYFSQFPVILLSPLLFLVRLTDKFQIRKSKKDITSSDVAFKHSHSGQDVLRLMDI